MSLLKRLFGRKGTNEKAQEDAKHERAGRDMCHGGSARDPCECEPRGGEVERHLPDDLLGVPDAQYAPLDGLAPGSAEAQDRQRQAVEELRWPLEVRTAKTGIVLRLVPAGSFTMGRPSTEKGDPVEGQHEVTLTKAFYCGKFEVTQGQWQMVMAYNASSFQSAGMDAPVETVCWDTCQVFLKRLCEMEEVPEGTYRLLTEAEWEYACRAGTTTAFCYGNDLDSSLANFDGNSPAGRGPKGLDRQTTVAVGSFRPNAWGLYDMHGNVREWCQDFYDGDDYPSGSVMDPLGPAWGRYAVMRGGAWWHGAKWCRSAARFWAQRCESSEGVGLRLARPLVRLNEAVGLVAGQDGMVPGLKMKMVYVEAGSFQMGSHKGHSGDEEPVHAVRIRRAFWMGKCEVTQSQYQAIMGSNPSYFKGADLPVDSVLWDEAVAFSRELTRREAESGRLPPGYMYRLPTEAEWEYAARGGSKSRGFVCAGSDDHDEVAWGCTNSASHTHPVGERRPNELGLHDMSGNVAEWCHDWYDENYYRRSPSSDPKGPSSGRMRVLRGGSWSDGNRCRVADRFRVPPYTRSSFFGFRVVASWPLD